mgnify:CR=1 FL=1
MKRLKTLTKTNEIFIIPTLGLLKCVKYRGLYDQKHEWRLCFAWLIWRASIQIWQEKEWRRFEY